MSQVGKILKLWGDKARAGVAVFIVVGCDNHVVNMGFHNYAG